ncbi:PepSY domain-containing protein [Novosphingobium tardum]|uniref:PepSY domain-containing protein n=1 Tax=Novosphingobium tardum TaxID=1538021 RepID=A0ABV8RRU5_9SPHN
MRRTALHLAATALVLLPLVAHAEPRRDEQGQVRREMREGNVRPLRDIERRVLPSMSGMQYLGPEYDATAMAYRLKFIRDGRVVFVDVDARSGQVLHQSR